MKNIYLAGAVRTPIGKFGGTLASWSAADLGVAVAKESLVRAKVSVEGVDDSIWGCARQAGGGPNVGRQITYRAGVPETVPSFTVNQACGSGLKAIILAAQEIVLGRANVVLAGGTESMSRVPYYADGARWGMRMGNTQLVDGMERDGLVERQTGPEDKRVVFATLTQQGEALFASVFPRNAQRIEHSWSSFTDEEKQTLTQLMVRLRIHLLKEEAGAKADAMVAAAGADASNTSGPPR